MHAGITPKYRGVHGVYWALANKDPQNCGVTVHLVDAGIDTGAIISQKNITVNPQDNFVTYPLLQLAEGIPLMKKAIEDILSNRLVIQPATGESRLWHHPTIWQYFSPK
jgi:methionyl-tRNA formyltransferase